MAGRRYLLMHISETSGHHRASCAIEQALARVDPDASAVSMDAARYISRPVRWAVTRTYRSLIRHQPDVWEYLYDNPTVHHRVQYFRGLLHRYQAAKLRELLERVRPDVIACTQAYPCGMVADFKKHHGLRTPLVGVLTDYAPHLYWFHDTVDAYVVPSEAVRRRFVQRGVDAGRVHVLGIPIDARFTGRGDRGEAARAFGLDPALPVLLVMGGGSGFGPIREIIEALDILPHRCQIVVVCGTNRGLAGRLRRERFRQAVTVLDYVERVPVLMDAATLLISKPGGLTSSEALAKRLPLVIVNPIPGQEAYNARYLLSQGAAVQAASPDTVRQTVRDLLDNPDRLEVMRRRVDDIARPTAAADIALLLRELAGSATVHDRPLAGASVG
jgi:processive 1,2-diacylglycerol beta-glucosyltransferase